MVRFFSYLVYIPLLFLIDVIWQLVRYDLSLFKLKVGYVFSIGFILFGLVFIIDVLFGIVRNKTLLYWQNETKKDNLKVSISLTLIVFAFLFLLPNIERSIFLSYLLVTTFGGWFRYLLLVRNNV